MSASSGWRWLRGPAGDAAWHMALDEALLDGCAGSREAVPPTVRTYRWSRPALSLGRHQNAAVVRWRAVLERGLDVVRRPTGGAAVIHGSDFTCAVVARLDAPPFCGGVVAAYGVLVRLWHELLRELGVRGLAVGPEEAPPRGRASCFAGAGRWEIVTPEGKLLGAAQLRRGRALLCQATLPLEPPPLAYEAALALEQHPPTAGLAGAAGRPIRFEEVEAAFGLAVGRLFGAKLAQAGARAGELERAAKLRAWKYLDAEWTRHGRLRPAAG